MQDEEDLKIIKEPKEKSLRPDWSNAPSVNDLAQDYTDAQTDHSSQVSTIRTYLDNLNVEGQAKVKSSAGRSSVVPKLIRKQAEWRYSSLSEPLLATEDLFDVAPVSWEDKKAAHQNAIILNNQFSTKIEKVPFINEYVRTAVNEGTVVVRTGWRYEEEEYEEEVEIFDYVFSDDPKDAEMINELAQLRQNNPTEFMQLPDQFKSSLENSELNQGVVVHKSTGEFETVVKTRILANHPTVEVCDYRDVVIDPTCKSNVNKASFIIYKFETSMSELEKDEKYSNLDDIKISESADAYESSYDDESDTSFRFKDKPRQKLMAYEYWGNWDVNGDGKVVPIVATYVGKTMIRLEENPYPDKKPPFVFVPFLPKKNSPYGEPDGALLEDNQKIIGAVTRGMIDIMGRSANGQQGIRKGALDASNRLKFNRGEDYEINTTDDPRQAIHMHTYPEIPQSAQVMIGLQNSEAEALTGVKSFSSGISGNALGNTATGIRSALDATSKRELDILRRLADGLTKVGRKILAMNSEFLSDEEIVRITNEEFITINRDDLAGNFDLKLSISTPEADEQKAQELAFMLQTTAQSMGPAFAQIILSDIARLRKMPDLARRIESYQPEPDPLAQKKAELEIQLLEAEIQYQTQRAQKEFASANLDMARVNTEAAKTGNLQSDTDLKDLNFLEQESGTKQERDLQKLDRQTEHKAAMSVLDARVKAITGDDSTTTTNGLRSV